MSRASLRTPEQLQRFLHPPLRCEKANESKHTERKGLPLFLPLSVENTTGAHAQEWLEVDFQSQVLLAQLIRVGVSPWYAKISSERQFVGEIVDASQFALQRIKQHALRPSEETRTPRIVILLVEELPLLLHRHVCEYRRAMQYANEGEAEAITLFLQSNSHPALSVDDQGALSVDEEYVNTLLYASLQGIVPPSHAKSSLEMLLLIDIIKGLIRGQLRYRGAGPWALVRILLRHTGDIEPDRQSNSSLHLLRASFTLAISLLQSLFAYIVLTYLDIFTPETRNGLRSPEDINKRGRKKRSATSVSRERDESSSTQPISSTTPTLDAPLWNWAPLLSLFRTLFGSRIVVDLLGVFAETALAWGGSRFLQQSVTHWLESHFLENPTEISGILQNVQQMVELSQYDPPAPSIQTPTLDVQQAEYEALLQQVLRQIQQYSKTSWTQYFVMQCLLHTNEQDSLSFLDEIFTPFLRPLQQHATCQDPPSCSSLAAAAGTRTLLEALERLSILLNPTLDNCP